jgi:hypothetical protein
MSTVTLVTNDYITLEYQPDRKLIYHTIYKPVSEASNIFMDTLEKGTSALKEYGAHKWLSDDRLNGPLSQDILDWAVKGWYKRTIDAGWQYWANVVPKELEAAGTLIPVINQLHELGLKMRVFTNVDAALTWLAKFPD